MQYQFASDITAGIRPGAWQVMFEALQGFMASYGDDAVTAQLVMRFPISASPVPYLSIHS